MPQMPSAARDEPGPKPGGRNPARPPLLEQGPITQGISAVLQGLHQQEDGVRSQSITPQALYCRHSTLYIITSVFMTRINAHANLLPLELHQS